MIGTAARALQKHRAPRLERWLRLSSASGAWARTRYTAARSRGYGLRLATLSLVHASEIVGTSLVASKAVLRTTAPIVLLQIFAYAAVEAHTWAARRAALSGGRATRVPVYAVIVASLATAVAVVMGDARIEGPLADLVLLSTAARALSASISAIAAVRSADVLAVRRVFVPARVNVTTVLIAVTGFGIAAFLRPPLAFSVLMVSHAAALGTFALWSLRFTRSDLPVSRAKGGAEMFALALHGSLVWLAFLAHGGVVGPLEPVMTAYVAYGLVATLALRPLRAIAIDVFQALRRSDSARAARLTVTSAKLSALVVAAAALASPLATKWFSLRLHGWAPLVALALADRLLSMGALTLALGRALELAAIGRTMTIAVVIAATFAGGPPPLVLATLGLAFATLAAFVGTVRALTGTAPLPAAASYVGPLRLAPAVLPLAAAIPGTQMFSIATFVELQRLVPCLQRAGGELVAFARVGDGMNIVCRCSGGATFARRAWLSLVAGGLVSLEPIVPLAPVRTATPPISAEIAAWLRASGHRGPLTILPLAARRPR